MLTLIQAAAPGTPIIYAPALATIEPHTARYFSGAVEHSLLGAAVTRLARYYGLPSEASTGGTDHHVPGIQAGYERAVNWTLPVLAWPDILVGPGLLSGSTVLSLEQMLIDVEVFRRCKRLARGIECNEEEWLDEVIDQVGPGGSFLAQRSTRAAMRGGEWYISQLGLHNTFEAWEAMGRPDLLDEIRQKIAALLAAYKPLPLDENVVVELVKIEQQARRMEELEL
jgi:trimethylamine--corrinoid protein Co-methyltransferase